VVFSWLYTIRPKVENFRRLGDRPDSMVGSISGLASLQVMKTANTDRQKFIILSGLACFGWFRGLFFALLEVLAFYFFEVSENVFYKPL